MKKYKHFLVLFLLFILAISICSCKKQNIKTSVNSKKEFEYKNRNLSGTLIIYHAGSLTIPFKELKTEFEKLHPNVDIKLTSGGSRTIARRITELGDKVDILASADYTVIDSLLIPDYAHWNCLFGTNSMVIMYTDKSKYAEEITSDNWYKVLLRAGVNYGHSEANADPCGYRTLLLWKLAEEFYDITDLNNKLLNNCPKNNIRPKSVELLSLLETGVLDYAFEYESVARQHTLINPDFKYITLPQKINLSTLVHGDFYKNASVELTGKKPGEIITKHGEPIVYSITMPSTGENREIALEFIKFFSSKDDGLKILNNNGQPTLERVKIHTGQLPDKLKNITN